MILTEIGEVGVAIDGQEIILRPSFYAMSKLGGPKELVAMFARIMDAKDDKELIGECYQVIMACTDEDVSEFFGYFDERLRFHPACAELVDIVVIAQHLLRHGIIGAENPKDRPPSSGDYTGEFRVADFAAQAIAHLGMSERDAWNMTMTGFIAAMRAKFPPDKNAKNTGTPTLNEYEETMKWFSKVKR